MNGTGKPFVGDKSFDTCPSCACDQLEALRLDVLGESSPAAIFTPTQRKLKFLRSQHGVVLRGNVFQMCRSCGFIFRQDSPAVLDEFLQKYVKD